MACLVSIPVLFTISLHLNPHPDNPRYRYHSAHMVERLDEALRDYGAQYDLLRRLLSSHSEKSDFIRFLTFRLEYNTNHGLSEEGS